jgi:hypothetical protein
MTFTTQDSAKARAANAFGRQRQREQRGRNILECEQIVAQLLSGLGRPAVGAETVAAEVIAATTVKARRIREQGRDDSGERNLLRQLLQFSPFGMAPPTPPATFDVGRPGAFRVVTKGGDPAPDEATVTDEAGERGGEPAVNSTVNDE